MSSTAIFFSQQPRQYRSSPRGSDTSRAPHSAHRSGSVTFRAIAGIISGRLVRDAAVCPADTTRPCRYADRRLFLPVMTRLPVRITRRHPGVQLPAYQTAGAAGFDLAASENLTVQSGEVALVPTGLVMAVPEGYFLGVFARSSTPLKRGLMVANGVGIVDSDYSGPEDEIKIEVFNFTGRPVE